MTSSKIFDQIGQFTTVPVSVIKLVPTIGANAYTLWTYLRYRTNSETGDAFPSYETIREDLGPEFHAREISRCIKVLADTDLLDRKKRFGQSTIYTLKAPNPSGGKVELEPEPEHSPFNVERTVEESAHSPFNVESKVLSTLKVKSFQRVKTNKNELLDRNNQTENAARGAGDSESQKKAPQPPEGNRASESERNSIGSTPPPAANCPPAGQLLEPELPDEKYLFEKVNAERAARRLGKQKRFRTTAQRAAFRDSIQFFNGKTRAEIDRQLAAGKNTLDAIVNGINWRRVHWGEIAAQEQARQARTASGGFQRGMVIPPQPDIPPEEIGKSHYELSGGRWFLVRDNC